MPRISLAAAALAAARITTMRVLGECVTIVRRGGTTMRTEAVRGSRTEEIRDVANGAVSDPVEVRNVRCTPPGGPLADGDVLTFADATQWRVGDDAGDLEWRRGASAGDGVARCVRVGPAVAPAGDPAPPAPASPVPASPDALANAVARLLDAAALGTVRRVDAVRRPRTELTAGLVIDVAPRATAFERLAADEGIREHGVTVCLHGPPGTAPAAAARAVDLLEGWTPSNVTTAAGTLSVACHAVSATAADAPGLSRRVLWVRFREYTRPGAV